MLWKCDSLLKQVFKKEKSNYWTVEFTWLSLHESNTSEYYFKFWYREYSSMTKTKGCQSYLKETDFQHTHSFMYLYRFSSLLSLSIYPYIYICALTDMEGNGKISSPYYKTLWIEGQLPRLLWTNIVLSIILQADQRL